MITLHSFGPVFGVMDASPFVVKVDLFLRAAQLEYNVKVGAGYLKKSPKGKLPFIVDDGEKIGDSAFILEHLKSKYHIDLDSHLTEQERATSYLINKSIEENLYWCLVYSRWADDKTWPIAKEAFFAGVPFPVSAIVPSIIRKGVIKNLHGQGISRHSHDEVLQITDKSLSALSVLLGENSYFFGDKISTCDVSAYAILCQFYLVDYTSEFNALAQKYGNLKAYCERIQSEYYAS